MKKILLSSLIAITSFFSANAQKDFGEIEVGFSFGYNTSILRNSNEDTEFKRSTNYLGSVEFFLNDRWGIKSGLNFEKKGWKSNSISFGVLEGNYKENNVEYDLSYLSIPLMANWHFGYERNWNLNFGFYTGFLLKAEEGSKNITKEFNTVDFGLAYGIGYKRRLSDRIKILFDFQSQSGFTKIFKESLKAKNWRGGVNVGILYGF
ncbi:porin family protein [Aureivirga sp. CE67]|uniref:porin family protein n=1 Tax=Aureivirga sp. CE67 TaxID=1788983 RepID=UPI0018C904CB|nr:porin family protein [Aureivirga sp. CE67]